MIDKFKNIGWAGLAMLAITLFLLLFFVFVRGSVWLTERYMDFFTNVNGVIFLLILLLVVLSIFPRLRIYTGTGIAYGTLIWGVVFWLFCLFITYQLWGFLGVFIGLVLAGVGVFVTAVLALIFDGQWFAALFILLNLAFIWGVRLLGVWIISKHKDTTADRLNSDRIFVESTSYYCVECGDKLESHNKFCSKCGARV